MSASTPHSQRPKGPVNDSIIVAVAGLVDDARTNTREPSHSDIEFQINRAWLSEGDPKTQGQTVGKAKRVRATLSWALEQAPDNGEVLVAALIALIRGKGGFRTGSPNFVGEDAISDATEAFRTEGYTLTTDGDLQPTGLDTLEGAQLTIALDAYVRRARRGSEDAALLVGTAKDLLEATAAHVISERFGQYPEQANFPTLLGQAFTALGLATPHTPIQSGASPQQRLERALYEAGCAVNALRNKQGSGHGRPWLPTVSDAEARTAVQVSAPLLGFSFRPTAPNRRARLLPDLTAFIADHRPHGPLTGDATEPAWNGYLLTVACPCGVVFERWVTPEDAELDLLRAASLN